MHKVYMLEDGVAYFHPRMELYGVIKPLVARMKPTGSRPPGTAPGNSDCGFPPVLSACTTAALGEAWPEMVNQDAFGNPPALCVGHRARRKRCKASAGSGKSP